MPAIGEVGATIPDVVASITDGLVKRDDLLLFDEDSFTDFVEDNNVGDDNDAEQDDDDDDGADNVPLKDEWRGSGDVWEVAEGPVATVVEFGEATISIAKWPSTGKHEVQIT